MGILNLFKIHDNFRIFMYINIKTDPAPEIKG